ncbi:MAG: hypothetical protein HC810_04740 [Acaryochloridaceae cyanobacterium RL_2_7]|nr:hypothetical protein [Acaryochloridaceae cyanobacterium RL_2_7]
MAKERAWQQEQAAARQAEDRSYQANPAPSYPRNSQAPAYQVPAPAYQVPAPAYQAPAPSYQEPAYQEPAYQAPAPAPAPSYQEPLWGGSSDPQSEPLW